MTTSDKSWDLIADIGGTNTRLASLQNGEIGQRATSETGGAGSILTAIEQFVLRVGRPPRRVMVAIAGPVSDGWGRVTNGQDRIEIVALKRSAQCADVQIINDFEAAAWSLATVRDKDILTLQGPDHPPEGHRIILGAGTGFGVGSLIATSGGFKALPGEGGHVAIAPADDFEKAVFNSFSELWPEILIQSSAPFLEAEAIVSGTGLPLLYQAVCKTRSQPQELKSAGQIFQEAKDGQPQALDTISIFKSHLARVAGNLAVSISPKGGVFFAGGVLQQNKWILDESFVATFNEGARFTTFRQSFPIYIYENPDVGLIGASNALTFG